MRASLCFVIALVLALAAAAPNAWQGGVMPAFYAEDAGAAARQAAGMTGGRVLDVQTRLSGEQAHYLVRVLMNDGRVKIIQIPGAPRGAASALQP